MRIQFILRLLHHIRVAVHNQAGIHQNLPQFGDVAEKHPCEGRTQII